MNNNNTELKDTSLAAPSSVVLTSSVAQTATAATPPQTRQKYVCKILDDHNLPVSALNVMNFPQATLVQHFAYAVQMYLNLLNSTDKITQMGATTMFLSEMLNHQQGEKIAHAPAIVEFANTPVQMTNILVSILPELKIPGVSSCKIQKETYTVPTRGVPVSQQVISLTAETQIFLNSLSDVKWQGLQRNYALGSKENVAWVRLPKDEASVLYSICLTLGLLSAHLRSPEANKPGQCVLMLNVTDIDDYIAAQRELQKKYSYQSGKNDHTL